MEGFIFVTVQEKSAAQSNQCSVSGSVMLVFPFILLSAPRSFSGIGIFFTSILQDHIFMHNSSIHVIQKGWKPLRLKFKQLVIEVDLSWPSGVGLGIIGL